MGFSPGGFFGVYLPSGNECRIILISKSYLTNFLLDKQCCLRYLSPSIRQPPTQCATVSPRYTVAKSLKTSVGGGGIFRLAFGAERLLGANQAPRCQHIKFNGERCGCPALQGKPVCRFHADTLETRTP